MANQQLCNVQFSLSGSQVQWSEALEGRGRSGGKGRGEKGTMTEVGIQCSRCRTCRESMRRDIPADSRGMRASVATKLPRLRY